MMSMNRMKKLLLIVAVIAPAGRSFGEIAWSDSPTFALDMLCQDPSDTGLTWSDSSLFTLDMLCQDPSDSGLAFGDSGVFVLQFADLDEDGDVDLYDFAMFAACFTDVGGVPPGCECADLDGDEDIGLSDHAYFADNLKGPGG